MEDSWLLPNIQGHVQVRFGCPSPQRDTVMDTSNVNNCPAPTQPPPCISLMYLSLLAVAGTDFWVSQDTWHIEDSWHQSFSPWMGGWDWELHFSSAVISMVSIFPKMWMGRR